MGLVLYTKPKFSDPARILFMSAPYKVMYGGRGGSKSWSFARALLILGSKRKLFILCAREIQRSIKESVHKLLSDQVAGLELDYFYKILDQEIIGANGTRVVFAGIRNNINAIKSMEGIDICAVFEANTIPHNSWEVLLPTIRRDPPYGPFGKGSEVWIEFNPELITDDTYQRFVVNPPDDALVEEVNWRDNPWFPEFSRKLKDKKRKDDYDGYLTVWEGKTRKTIEGAIYAKELAKAIEDERVGPHIRMVRGRGVTVSFDLGDQDMTSMWMMQQVGTQHNAVDHYSNCGFDIVHYLEILQERKTPVARILLPHDAKQKHQAARRLAHNTIEKQVRAVYPAEGVVIIVPATKPLTRVNALRALFPRLLINDVTCSGGIQSLTHYKFGVRADNGQRTQEPLHDWASHDADAIGQYAVWLREGVAEETPYDEEMPHSRLAGHHAQGWME